MGIDWTSVEVNNAGGSDGERTGSATNYNYDGYYGNGSFGNASTAGLRDDDVTGVITSGEGFDYDASRRGRKREDELKDEG